MGYVEFGDFEQSGETETLEARRQQINNDYAELRAAVAELVLSGAAEDGYTKTPELQRAEEIGNRLKGEPIRGVLKGRRYHIDDMPRGWLSAAHTLPYGFESPRVLGVFEGAVKLHKVQENAELMIGVSPFALSNNEDIKANYQHNGLAQTRWQQPLGLRNQDRNKRLWLPAVDFEFVSGHPDDDYLAKAIGTAEGFRAILRHRFPPESQSAE